MKNILILHPYRENYTEIYKWLPSTHQFTILTDESKLSSFEQSRLANVSIISTTDYQNNCKSKAREVLQLEKFDAIVALDEFDITTAAELREEFNIEGQSVAEAEVFRDKNLMTKRVKELGYTVPGTQKISTFAELQDFYNVHKNIILKPLSGAGSVDTFHIKSKSELELAANIALKNGEEVLVQEYINSNIYHIDGFLDNGKVVYCEPSLYIYNPLLIKEGISAAAVSLDHDSLDYTRLVEYASTLASQLYPGGTFLFHLEVFYNSKEITFLEIACRMGGARIRQNIELKLTHNPLQLLVYGICGEQLPTLPTEFPVTGWLLTAKRKGVITQLPTLTDELKRKYSIFDYIEYTKVANTVNDAFHSADAIIGISVSGKDFVTTKNTLLNAETWLIKNTRYE